MGDSSCPFVHPIFPPVSCCHGILHLRRPVQGLEGLFTPGLRPPPNWLRLLLRHMRRDAGSHAGTMLVPFSRLRLFPQDSVQRQDRMAPSGAVPWSCPHPRTYPRSSVVLLPSRMRGGVPLPSALHCYCAVACCVTEYHAWPAPFLGLAHPHAFATQASSGHHRPTPLLRDKGCSLVHARYYPPPSRCPLLAMPRVLPGGCSPRPGSST